MCPCDAAPHNPVARALLQGLGLVHIGQALAQVEIGLALGAHTIDLYQGGMVVLVGLAPTNTERTYYDMAFQNQCVRSETSGEPGTRWPTPIAPPAIIRQRAPPVAEELAVHVKPA